MISYEKYKSLPHPNLIHPVKQLAASVATLLVVGGAIYWAFFS